LSEIEQLHGILTANWQPWLAVIKRLGWNKPQLQRVLNDDDAEGIELKPSRSGPCCTIAVDGARYSHLRRRG